MTKVRTLTKVVNCRHEPGHHSTRQGVFSCRWKEAHPDKVRQYWTSPHGKAIRKEIDARHNQKPERKIQKAVNQRRYHSSDPSRTRATQLRTKYGISVEDYRKMWESQGKRCALCMRQVTWRAPDVDHDHTIEKLYGVMVIRGLLCSRCNQALGRFEHSDEVLSNLVKYVQKTLRTRKRYYSEGSVFGPPGQNKED